jgi:hypothetical protein
MMNNWTKGEGASGGQWWVVDATTLPTPPPPLRKRNMRAPILREDYMDKADRLHELKKEK